MNLIKLDFLKKGNMMKTTGYHIHILFAAAVNLVIMAVIFANLVRAEDNTLNNLRGPAFNYPYKEFPMPEDWKKKTIQYDFENSDVDVVVNLDGQMHEAWDPIIQKYAKDHNLKIITTPGTCGISAGKLARKEIDVGTFCCPPGEADRLPGLKYHTSGIAALALLVHPDNPVDNITLEQARQIFQGEIYNWTELEGSRKIDRRIQPIARLHCKLRPGHWRLLLNDKDRFSPDLFEVGAMPDMISQIAVNPGAIGYEVLWITQLYKDRGNVKFLKINGYSPDNPSDVISGNYPLYRAYHFSTWESENVANPDAQKLVNYILKQVEHLDKKFHIISASRLKKAGWKFSGTELIGEPGK